MTPDNTRSGWRQTGLFPWCPDAVLDRMSVSAPKTPDQPTFAVNKTPSTAAEAHLQQQYLVGRLAAEYRLQRVADKLGKATQAAMEELELVKSELTAVREFKARAKARTAAGSVVLQRGGVMNVAAAHMLIEQQESRLRAKAQRQEASAKRKETAAATAAAPTAADAEIGAIEGNWGGYDGSTVATATANWGYRALCHAF